MDFTNTGNFFREDIHPITGLELSLFGAALISLVLNGLLMHITLNRERAKFALDTILLCIIAILDLGLSLVFLISQIWKWSTSYSIVIDGGIWCHLISILHWTLSLSSLNIVSLLSLVRYLVIVRGHKVNNSRWTWAAIIIILLILTQFIIQDLTNVPMVFPSTMLCASIFPPENTALILTLKICMLLTIFPPFIVIPFCYFSVTSHYHKLVSKLTPATVSGIPQQHRRKILGLISIVLAYIFTLSPEYLQAFISLYLNLRLNSWVDSFAKISYFCVSIVNALFTLIFHEEIYNELRYILDRCHILPLN